MLTKSVVPLDAVACTGMRRWHARPASCAGIPQSHYPLARLPRPFLPDCPLQMKPNPFLDMGITIGKINAADQLNGREQMLVMA